MNKNINKKILPTLTIIFFLFFWEILVRAFDIPMYLIPSPTSIFLALLSDFETISRNAGITFFEAGVGILIAATLGISLAISMDIFAVFKDAVYPLLVISQTIPVIVLAPIFVIYLGFGIAPKVLIVVLMCFFPIAIAFAAGLQEVDTRMVNLAKSYGASKMQVYSKVKIPAAFPSLISGLKVAVTYSVSGAVVGEWLSSNSGLGYYMLKAKNGFMMDKVFASIFVVVLLSLFMNFMVKLFERKDFKDEK